VEMEEIPPQTSILEPLGISKRLFFPNLLFLAVNPYRALWAQVGQERGPPIGYPSDH